MDRSGLSGSATAGEGGVDAAGMLTLGMDFTNSTRSAASSRVSLPFRRASVSWPPTRWMAGTRPASLALAALSFSPSSTSCLAWADRSFSSSISARSLAVCCSISWAASCSSRAASRFRTMSLAKPKISSA